MFNRAKRQVPKPEIIRTHQSGNPMFQSTSPEELNAFRRQVLLWFCGILLAVAVGLGLYGPWLKIEAVEVSGTRLLNPESVRAVVAKYLDQRRWFVVPNGNLLTLSTAHLAKSLDKKISVRLSIEGATIQKVYPHNLKVRIIERTPLFIWQSGQSSGTIDKHGVIIDKTIDPASKNLPVVIDIDAAMFAVDEAVLKKEVMTALTTLREGLDRSQIKYKHFLIPRPACAPQLEPNATEQEEQPANTNAEVLPKANENLNTSPSSETSANTNAGEGESVVIPDCDLKAAKYSSQEIHVTLADGPVAYFDRHQQLRTAATTLQRVLQDPVNRQASYIDLRFDERVFVR